jgi:Ran GTPase-activating protein (RanGAP) involved in mRNA processing and transport
VALPKDIEKAAEKVVRTAKRSQAPLLEAIEVAQSRLGDAAKGLEQALVEAKQALTVLELLKRQIKSLRDKIKADERKKS